MDDILSVGEVAHSNSLNCDVICVEDDFEENGKYGCNDCIFNDAKHFGCLTDTFTDKFECRHHRRPDGKDVHYEKHEQD